MSVVQSKWKLKCLPFIEDILDPFQSCACKITFFWKADMLAMQREISWNTSAVQMPHLLRVSCGPGWTVSERGLWGWLCTSGTITSVGWSVNTQGNQASSSSSASFSSHDGEAHFCLMDQRADEDSIDVARSLTWGTFPLVPWYTKASLQPLKMKHRPLCLLYKNYIKRGVRVGGGRISYTNS